MQSEPSPGRVHAGTAVIDPAGPIPVFAHNDVGIDPAQAPCLEANWIVWSGQNSQPHGWKDGAGALIALDTLFSSAELETALLAELSRRGVELATLTVVASHSHNTPMLDPGKPLLGRCDPAYLAQTATVLADSIAGVLDEGSGRAVNLIRFGQAEVPGSCFRRRRGLSLYKKAPYAAIDIQLGPNLKVDIPRTLRLWLFGEQGAGGQTHFALLSWPCHPISRRSARMISADYVGVIRQALRDRLGARLPVLFAPGCCGDIRPDIRARFFSRYLLYPYPFQPFFARPGPEGEAAFDHGLTTAVDTALAGLQTLPVQGGVTAAQDVLGLDQILTGQDGGEMPISGMDLWGVRVIGLGAEPSFYWTETLGWDAAAPDRLLTGYTGPVYGYLPVDRQIPEGGYEVDRFRYAFELQGHYSRTVAVEPAVIGACNTMLERLAHNCAAGRENV